MPLSGALVLLLFCSAQGGVFSTKTYGVSFLVLLSRSSLVFFQWSGSFGALPGEIGLIQWHLWWYLYHYQLCLRRIECTSVVR